MQGEIINAAQITGTLAEVPGVEGALTIPEIIYTDCNPYEGEYTITPTDHKQIIPIKGKTAAHEIVIDPIPSNYGKLTWDGISLRIT